MRVLVACESSGVVREAFRALGHDAWSCDLLMADDGSRYHLHCNVHDIVNDGWDLMIAHPPCTHLAVSGARWFKNKQAEQWDALIFVRWLMDRPIPRICIENPVSIISTRIRKPDQIVDPFNFGDPFRKRTCLWLQGLPKLQFTSDLTTGEQACWKMGPSPDRWKKRSLTYPGMAAAMAAQWGGQL